MLASIPEGPAQGWLQGYVIGGEGKSKFDQLASVDVEV